MAAINSAGSDIPAKFASELSLIHRDGELTCGRDNGSHE
jgi:hypothetical protein